MRYSVVDLRGKSALSLAAPKALLTRDRYVGHQCAVRHLADASEWGVQDFPKGAPPPPNRTRIDALYGAFNAKIQET